MIDQYLAPEQHAKKSVHTKKKYGQNANQIKNTVTKSVDLLGNVDADRITPGVIRKYMDTRPPVTANRETAFLSVCYQWCIERDLLDKKSRAKVRRNIENPDDRYVKDAEYQAVYQIAPDYIRCTMELAYLCRMRMCEVLTLRESDIKDTGLYIKRRKGSRDNITLFTERLNAAIELSRSLSYPQARPINPTLTRGFYGTASDGGRLQHRLAAPHGESGKHGYCYV